MNPVLKKKSGNLAPILLLHFTFSGNFNREARKANAVTGVNHTPFTDEHRPTLFFAFTDFITEAAK